MNKNAVVRQIWALCTAAGLTLGMAGVASAAPNLVVNGGFESGTNFDPPWSAVGDVTQFCPGGPDPDVFGGNCSAAFSTFSAPATLSQTLSLTPGASYDMSFRLEAFDHDSASFFTVTLGGVILRTLSNPDTSNAFQLFTVPHFAALASTESLVFTARADIQSMFLDDVSISPAAVPEPASLALLGIGLAGLAASRRRKST